jgi:hypothetical protein
MHHLPGYPQGHDRQRGGPPERLFEPKELANGFSIAQAHVRLRSQPDGHPKDCSSISAGTSMDPVDLPTFQRWFGFWVTFNSINRTERMFRNRSDSDWGNFPEARL